MLDTDKLVKLILSTKDADLLKDFFLGLTTEKERAEIVQRIEIIKRLLQGEPQHKIAAELGVGVATVTRGSKELAKGHFKLLRKEFEKNGS